MRAGSRREAACAEMRGGRENWEQEPSTEMSVGPDGDSCVMGQRPCTEHVLKGSFSACWFLVLINVNGIQGGRIWMGQG